MANVIDERAKTQAILKRMADVRYDLDEDVQEMVEGARDMGEWRSYVRAYPLWCLGGALALGYLVVPRRNQAAVPAVQNSAPVAIQSRPATTVSPLIGQAVGILGERADLVLHGPRATLGPACYPPETGTATSAGSSRATSRSASWSRGMGRVRRNPCAYRQPSSARQAS